MAWLPPATWPPLLCHTGTLSPPWLHHRHHSRLVTRREIRTLLGCGEWSRRRHWRQGTLLLCSAAVLQCCSAAVLQCCRRGQHPGPGQRAAWEPSLHILTPEAGHEQRTPSCVVWRYHQGETWKSGHRNGNSALYTLTDSRLANCPWFISSFVYFFMSSFPCIM